jgi:hypothetical protein
MRGWKIFSRSLLRMPEGGIAAWISAGVGKLCCPTGRGVETLGPANKKNDHQHLIVGHFDYKKVKIRE